MLRARIRYDWNEVIIEEEDNILPGTAQNKNVQYLQAIFVIYQGVNIIMMGLTLEVN